MPYDIGDALKRIENLLLQSMSRNLHRHLGEEQDEGFRWTMWQAEQLTSLGNWSARNLKRHAADFRQINDAAIRLLQESGQQAELAEEQRLLRSGVQQAQEFFDVPDDKMQSLLHSVRHDLSQAEHSILRQADDMYRKAVFDAHVYLQSGSGDLKRAIDMAVEDLNTRGIRSVTYRNGRRVEASAYARMALRTANVRARMTGEGAARDRMGVHTIMVPVSGIACKKCAPWMGKVLVDDVYCSGTAQEAQQLGVSLLSETIRQGFLHPQCNCSPVTYVPGISKPPEEVTDEDRAEAVKRYRLTQQQRYRERQVRRWKRAEKAAPDATARKAAAARRKEWQKSTQALCDEYPEILRRDYHREKVYDFPDKPIVPEVIERPAPVPEVEVRAERSDVQENARPTVSESAENRLTEPMERGIIESRGEQPLEQAKKRDHKIMITDMAISKVPKVQLSDFSDEQTVRMQEMHRELLRTAQLRNDSNEVLFITDLTFQSEVSVLGGEFKVSPGKNPFAVSVIMGASRQSLVYLHNHPSTNIFSLGDIDTFICEQAIKTMSVVTNQGEVYLLNKLETFTFSKAKALMHSIYDSFPDGAIDDSRFVAIFLKRCREGGIEYAKSK